MKNISQIITSVALLVGAVVIPGCVGQSQNYQLDEIVYRDATPFEISDGSVVTETTEVTMRYNQERTFGVLTVAVDGTLNWDPTLTEFGQAAGDRSGGFYLYAEGYSTVVNNQAVADQTAGDTAQLTVATEAGADVVGKVVEGAVSAINPASGAGALIPAVRVD